MAWIGLIPKKHILLSQNFLKFSIIGILEEVVVDYALVKVMDQVLDICNAALFIRNRENIRVRQPLKNLKIILSNVDSGTYVNYIQPFEELIKDEINVKSIEHIEEKDIAK